MSRLVIPVSAACLVLALALPARAFDLTNCTIQVTSLDAENNVLATAQGPGPGGTQDDPLLVAWDGTVHYVASTGDAVLTDPSWHVDVYGVPTPIRGSDANAQGATTAEDMVSIKDNLPLTVSGLFYVSGEITSPDGSCTGGAWLKLDEDPLTTVPFWVSIGVALVGVVLLWFAQPSVRTNP